MATITQKDRDFLRFSTGSGKLAEYECDDYRTAAFRWCPKVAYRDDSTLKAANFGYVVSGEATITTAHSIYQLSAGHYFALPPGCEVSGGTGFITRHGDFLPLTQIGGPIESSGRLRYISGCTDTLLIPPPRLGNACLNALYFPPDTDQQTHTHPSIRIGVVASGSGRAILPGRSEPLNVGDIFVIFPDSNHSFRTTDQPMTVIAYHPDSDFGPRDDDHPMINRTIVPKS